MAAPNHPRISNAVYIEWELNKELGQINVIIDKLFGLHGMTGEVLHREWILVKDKKRSTFEIDMWIAWILYDSVPSLSYQQNALKDYGCRNPSKIEIHLDSPIPASIIENYEQYVSRKQGFPEFGRDSSRDEFHLYRRVNTRNWV